MQAVYVLVAALFIAMVLVPPLMRFAGDLGLTDRPDERKIHSRVIPRSGGIAIVAGAVIPVLVWVPMRPDLSAFLAAAGILFVFGVLDDRFNLDYRLKFLGQLMAAAVVTLAGGVLVQYLPFMSSAPLPLWLSAPITIVVLVGLTNAVNLSDGLDGLAGGVSLLALGCLALLAYECSDSAALMTAVAIMGATFGFLRFNTNPAQIFMGDTGSQFLGFATGVLAIVVTQRPDSAVAVLVPLLILGLPILDTLNVMTRRVLAGRSPFSPDRQHLHHQLIGAGLSQNQAVIVIYGLQTLMIGLAYLLRYSTDLSIVGVYAVFSLGVLYGLHHLSRYEEHLAANEWLRDKHPSEKPLSLRDVRTLLVQWPFRILTLALPLTLLIGALSAPSVGADVGMLAGSLLVLLLAALLVGWRFGIWIERLSAYFVALAVAYFASLLPGIEAHRDTILFALAALAVLTAFWVRFAWIDFRVTSLDVLILIIAITMPSLEAPLYARFGVVALGAVVFFYAIEVLLSARQRDWGPLRLSVIAVLAVFAVKGLLSSL